MHKTYIVIAAHSVTKELNEAGFEVDVVFELVTRETAHVVRGDHDALVRWAGTNNARVSENHPVVLNED